MNVKSRKTLEFDKVLTQISTYAVSEKAKEKTLNITPMQEKIYIEELLNQVEEADKILYFHSLSPSFSVDNIDFALEKASVMSILTMGELLKIARTLRISRNLQSLIIKVKDDSIALLKDLAGRIFTNKDLEEQIEMAIISESEMSDNASNELRVIRNKIRKIGDNIKAKLYNFANSPAYSKYLQDNIITVRNDRYVIPLKSEYKGAIPGLIHDQSSSGATIYVEPMVILELNNDLKTYLIEESKEIERILKDFTLKVSQDAEKIKHSFEIITELDVIFAKAIYANHQKAIKPLINDKGYIDIQKARHPLISVNTVISNTVYIGKEFSMLFITGPNTGGKTVCLKLVGLCTLMALSGIYVPAVSADIGVFQNIFCDIGDEQSIEQSLSTFSSHINNIKHIIDNLSKNSIVLLDELGAGTDPAEGASLALSITKFIKNTGAKAIITTHYNELKEYAMVADGVQNASMEFDPSTYSPTYKLTIGVPGASNALLIASKLGLKQDIIEDAKLGVKGQNIEFEKVLSQLQLARKEAENNMEQTDNLRIETLRLKQDAEKERERLLLQRERLNLSVRKETKKLVENSMEEANEVIQALKELLDNPDETSLFKAYELRKKLKKFIVNDENEFELITQTLEGEVKAGDTVLVKSLNTQGVVTSLNPIKNEAHITMGSITSKISIDNLVKVKAAKPNKKEQKHAVSELKNYALSSEINIIGTTTDQVQTNLECFIDQAYTGGLKEIRIIHGIGEGRLRKAVQSFLAKHRLIESYRDGKYGEGGKGVTIAIVK